MLPLVCAGPPLVPGVLLSWVLQQLCHLRASELWKVQLVALLCHQYLVTTQQALQVRRGAGEPRVKGPGPSLVALKAPLDG